MLQFITTPGAGPLSPLEQARKAMAGGCSWIVIDMPGASDDEVRRVAAELRDECEETNTFLLIRGHIDVVDDLKVSGIQLPDVEQGAAARKRLGAHAIIGVDAASAEEVKQLKRHDLDYAFLTVGDPAKLSAIVEEVRGAGVEVPMVAGTGVTLENIDEIMATGVNGVAMGEAIVSAPDPGLYTAKVMDHLFPQMSER